MSVIPSNTAFQSELIDTRQFPTAARMEKFEEHVRGGARQLKRRLSFHSLGDTNENVIIDERLKGTDCYLTRLESSGYRVTDENPQRHDARPDSITVGVIERGMSEARTSNGSFKVREGDIYLHATTNFETAIAQSHVVRLVFPSASLKEMFRRSGEFVVLRESDPMAPVLKSAISGLEALLRGTATGSVDLMSKAAVQLASQVLQHDIMHSEVSGYDHIRRRAAEYIHDNLAVLDLNISDLADYVGTSRATLYRAFEGLGGVAGYITFVRLEKARALIGLGTLDKGGLSAIAYMCGFSSPVQLSRAFKRVYGISPTQLGGG